MTEPTEEMPQEPAETLRPQEPAPTEKRARRGLIVGLSALTALVVLVALLFTAFNHRSTVSAGAAPTPRPPTPTPSIILQRYTDPNGLFTLSIPKGWTVQIDSRTSEVGDSHGNVAFRNLTDDFGGPPTGQNTITVRILVWPIENARQRQWMCGAWPPSQNFTTLAGLPAATTWAEAVDASVFSTQT